MLRVHADPITVNCRKVLAGLQLMDIDYEHVEVDYFAGEHRADPYLVLNPMASLPALEDDDFVLWESNAILQYVADKHGRTAFYPTELRVRADINRWLLWEASAWFPSCYVYLVENCVKPLLKGSPDPAVLDLQSENFRKLAGILDARLAGSAWLCGDSPTIADVAVAAPMHLHAWSKLPLEPHPHLVRWMRERVETLPVWRATHIGEGFTVGEVA